jgi:hypothetical protein
MRISFVATIALLGACTRPNLLSINRLDGGVDLSSFQPADLAVGIDDLSGSDLTGRDLAQPPVDLSGRDLSSVNCSTGCVLGSFSAAPELTIVPPRTAYVLARTSTRVYLVGGQEGGTNVPTNSVAVATLNSDGTLGQFANASIALTAARQLVAGTIANGWLYVVGGEGPGALGTETLTTVERAPINSDGTLGSFVPAGSSLTTARAGHQVLAAGGFLYAIGGTPVDFLSQTPLSSVERALINADGSLGAFGAAGSLPVGKHSAGLLVTASAVYLVGGTTSTGAVDTIERAPLVAGNLGLFMDSGLRLRTRRAGLVMLAVGNSAFAVGGGSAVPDGGGALTFPRALESASLGVTGTLGTFSTSTIQLVKGRGGHGAVVLGVAAYVIGGFDGTVDLDSVERAPLQ